MSAAAPLIAAAIAGLRLVGALLSRLLRSGPLRRPLLLGRGPLRRPLLRADPARPSRRGRRRLRLAAGSARWPAVATSTPAAGRRLVARLDTDRPASCLTIESAGGRFARRRVNQPGIGSIVFCAGVFDSCSSMSTYFLTITGHA